MPENTELIWVYGGASGKRFIRDGDLGADPADAFYIKAENAINNYFEISGNRLVLNYGLSKQEYFDLYENKSKEALENYLGNFDEAFRGKDISWLRSWFNDSYEVDDSRFWCNWIPGFLEEFEARRGYKLQEHLPAFFGEGDVEEEERVLSDYRETVTELFLSNYTQPWDDWAADQGKITRLQAHGSPGNILDLYAASDIPETEGKEILRMKFASSAANVTGKNIVSAEAATHLNESFTSSLSDLKKNLDLLYLGGVNHTFYHGTAYSPVDEAWPGWFFYVAIHLNPQNPIWEDFPAFNSYATNVQSFMQSGQPNQDILLYYPIYDRYARRHSYRAKRVDGDGPHGKLLEHYNMRGEGWGSSVFKSLADTMQKEGYAMDFISDLQLQDVDIQKDRLLAGGNEYHVIVLPEISHMPLETFTKVLELVRAGATVIIQNQLPEDVPGLHLYKERQATLSKLKGEINFGPLPDNLQQAKLGKGMVYLGKDINKMLALEGIRPEPMTAIGIKNIRRKDENGSFYFMINENTEPIDGWVPILAKAVSVVHFDPMNRKTGVLESRKRKQKGTEIYLQLDPGESCILKTYQSKIEADRYNYLSPSGEGKMLTGEWKLSFLKGGPVLPDEASIQNPASWTLLPGEDVKKFSGTAAYSIRFAKPETPEDNSFKGWWLDLGRVAESARIILNEKEMGVLLQAPYRIFLPRNEFKEDNLLEIRVTNLPANRIADLDRRGVFWKKFYNNNLRAANRENVGPDGMFTAAQWEALESGLIGPVSLIPAKSLH